MRVAKEQTLSIDDFFKLANDGGGIYEIETPQGWIEIGALVKKVNKECFTLKTKHGMSLSGSNDHYVETTDGWVRLEDIDVQNCVVLSKYGEEEVVALESIGVHDTFDLEVLNDEHKYYANGIVSHNTGKTTIGNVICNLSPDNTVIWITPEILQENNYKAISSIKALYKLADFLSPCIIILEDLDLFSQDRERGGDIVSLGALMNILDGVNSIDNSVTIGTTNRLLSIEAALRNRPGRFDRIIEIPPLTNELRSRMFKERLSDWKIGASVFEYLVDNTTDWTGAEVQELINSLNLKHISTKRKKKKVDHQWAEEIIKTMSEFGVGEASSSFGFSKKD